MTAPGSRRSRVMGFLLFCTATGLGCAEADDTPFEQVEIPIATHNLFDLGVTDIDADGAFDIFTTNHNARQAILMARGPFDYEDRLVELGLSQDRRLPGTEDVAEALEPRAPGLHIMRAEKRFLYLAVVGEHSPGLSGTITAHTPVAVEEQTSFDVRIAESATSTGGTTSSIDFASTGPGRLRLRTQFSGTRYRVDLSPDVPLERVFVGALGRHPAEHGFLLQWRDRHSMAWTDYDGDGHSDVFIGRGGLQGRMDEFPEPHPDELLIHTEAGFRDRTSEAGLWKGTCPARETAWVDYDSDGRVDLYVACGTSANPRNDSYPNLLFVQQANGTMEERARESGLDLPAEGAFVWIDPDGDGDPDLFWADADGSFSLYRNSRGSFVAEALGAVPEDRSWQRTTKLSLGDFDSDGDIDVFSASLSRTALFVCEEGSYRMQDVAELALPERAAAAGWVDYDNDGRLDLHAVPGGMFRQTADGRFEQTGLVDLGSDPAAVFDARLTWFDADGDGRRDGLVAVAEQGLVSRLVSRLWRRRPVVSWQAALFRNRNEGGHWLSVDLAGSRHNRDAIGARVLVRAGDSLQASQVGAAEGSHFSQGHYRVYFGLGEAEVADEVRIVWPDGRESVAREVEADRTLEIAWPGPRAAEVGSGGAGTL